jgi:hypothetical protein
MMMKMTGIIANLSHPTCYLLSKPIVFLEIDRKRYRRAFGNGRQSRKIPRSIHSHPDKLGSCLG